MDEQINGENLELSGGELRTIEIFMLAAALKAPEGQRKNMLWALYSGAVAKGYSGERIEQEFNAQIYLRQLESRKKEGEEMPGYWLFYDSVEEEALSKALQEMRKSWGGKEVIDEEALKKVIARWKRTDFSQQRMMDHLGYYGLPMDQQRWEKLKNWYEFSNAVVGEGQARVAFRETGLGQEGVVVDLGTPVVVAAGETKEISEELMGKLDELMSRWRISKQNETGERLMDRKSLRENGKRLRQLLKELNGYISASELQELYRQRQAKGYA